LKKVDLTKYFDLIELDLQSDISEWKKIKEKLNKAGSIGSVSKIIFNSKFFSLYFKDEKFYGEIIRVTRLQKGLALVRPINKPTIEGAEIIPTTVSKGIGGQFEMRFGT
jgi:hypothetical protein